MPAHANLARRKTELLQTALQTSDVVARINSAVRAKQEMRDRIIAGVNDPHTTTSVLVTIEALLEDRS